MPKISELPNNAELTGNELIAIVQDGETRQITLTELTQWIANWIINNSGGGGS